MPIQDERKLLAPTGIESLLRNVVHERTGIFFEDARLSALREKLEPLARERNCYSLLDYYYLLKYEENGREDWFRVMDALSVQETYFWREMGQIRMLVDTFVPAWFQIKDTPLRIWSSASASGEEPYSILLALLEAGWGSHPIQIVGSDASHDAIQKSRAAVYREKSLRNLPADLKERYFIESGKEWRLRPEISERVTFQQANLLDVEAISPLARAPVVFCRNAFIYFSPHAIRQTIATFASRMPKGGYLLVGASESLLRLTTDFELKEIGEAFVYVRL
jgi:chemotaxis protein methyltransferase CheR